jgi:hypothetical protein
VKAFRKLPASNKEQWQRRLDRKSGLFARVLLGALGQWPPRPGTATFRLVIAATLAAVVLVGLSAAGSGLWVAVAQALGSRSPEPTRPAAPPVARFDLVTFVCPSDGTGDYLTVDFHAQPPQPPSTWWVFVLPVGSPAPPHYFPSRSPMSDGEGGYHTRVYIGPATQYEIYLTLTLADADETVRKYIAAREVDGNWGLGMAWPEPAAFRAMVVRDRTC